MRKVEFTDLDLIDFKSCWDHQEKLNRKNVETKIDYARRKLDDPPTQDTLIFCQHPHVYTLGKSGDIKNLLADEQKLKEIDAVYYHINRGGDITYHGPGQLVVYPILDLEHYWTDIHKYLRQLEEAVILTLEDYGLKGERYEGYTGVWFDTNDEDKARKICAIGVRCSRWITMHGLAFNINTDLSYFEHIVPCGIEDKAVTSLQRELGRQIEMDEVKSRMKKHLSSLFQFELHK